MLVREEYKPMAQTSGEEAELPPWPSEWDAPGGVKPTAVVIAFGIFGLAAGIVGVAQVGTGAIDGSTIILLSGGIFAIALSSGTALLRLRVRRRSVAAVHISQTEHGSATVVPNSRGVWAVVVAALSAGLLGFGFIALMSWGLVLFGGDTGGWVIFQTLLSTAFVAGIIWFLWRTQREPTAQGSLRLTPTGVAYKSLGPEESAPWDALAHIFPSCGDSPDIAMGVDSSRASSTSIKKGNVLRISGAFLSVDPALAYHALVYYLDHPGARSELGTERSVERIRRADFPE
ncbi:hypothetical protein [Salinifilum ghardaiensis]